MLLYLDYMSQPCRALAILMRISRVKYEEKIVSFVTGETRSEWFSKINPMRRVPVMEDTKFKLTESVAIAKYLVASRPDVADSWYPGDIHQRALVDEYLAYQHAAIRRLGALVFISQALRPHISGKPAVKEDVEKSIKEFEVALDQFESYYLSRGDYITGPDVTLADLFAICELLQPGCTGYDVTQGRPRLLAWMARVKARLQPHFDEVHKEIIDFGMKYHM